MNRVTPFGPVGDATSRPKRRSADQKGFHDIRSLPDTEFDGVWESIILPSGLKDRLLAQAGTGKTSLARGLASRTAASLGGTFTFIEVDPHALASAAHGKTQQAVSHLLGTVLAEE